METLPKLIPNVDLGVEVINECIKSLEAFFNLKPNQHKSIFFNLFPDYHQQAYAKFKDNKVFSGFIMNLDYPKQIKFLDYITGGVLDFEYPECFDIERFRVEEGLPSHIGKHQMLSLAVFFGKTTFLETFPEALFWFQKFTKFAYNNGINDDSYEDNTFGDFQNWAKYWSFMDVQMKEKHLEKLVNYE